MARSLERTFRHSHTRDEFFDRAMIFHTRDALHTTANIDSVWRYRFDRAPNVLRI
jgi:hypothetical protein